MDKKTGLKLIKTGKLSTEQMLDVVNWTESDAVGKAVVKITDLDKLNTEQLFNFAGGIGRLYAWEAVAKKFHLEGLNNKELFRLGNKANELYFWSIIAKKLRLDKFNNDQLMALGEEAGNGDFWGIIARRLNLKKFSVVQLLDLGEKANNWSVWRVIIETGRLNVEQLFAVGKKASSLDSKSSRSLVWDAVIKKLKIDELSVKRLLIVARNTNNNYLREEIVRTGKLSTNQMLVVGKRGEAFGEKLWNAIVEMIDFSKLSNDQLFAINNKAKRENVWQATAEAFDFSKLSNDQLSAISNMARSVETSISIIRSGKLNVEQMFVIGKEANSKEVWNAIAEKLKTSPWKSLVKKLKK